LIDQIPRLSLRLKSDSSGCLGIYPNNLKNRFWTKEKAADVKNGSIFKFGPVFDRSNMGTEKEWVGIMSRVRLQKTIQKAQGFSGLGLHKGVDVEICFRPASEGQGVFFRRIDLPGKPVIPATVEYVTGTSRGTDLAVGPVKVHTVEHVLAAVRAFEIDNLCIDLSNIEPPSGDGSSSVFVEMLEKARVVEMTSTVPVVSIKTPLFLSQGEVQLIALPSSTYQISYTLHYPKTPSLGSQFISMEVSQKNFQEKIARCRTFALYEELSMLMDKGLICGGSLENAVVVNGEAVISKGGLVCNDEAVRHKVLDLIGDLSLVGVPFTAHIIALRSGHSTNCQFAKLLYQHVSMENQ
jgi:UDP-3-O-[3-hydroxymyristoyl] N-acetylglucosamine deacetylase